MALDSRYIIASDLQVLFRDKDTGAPLSAGVITFYEDEARTVLKPVYKLSGSPPNYSYVAIQNPVTLSAIGTFQDPQTGDDIVPYYFPYDANGNIELYYITVYSSGGVLQFTREAWPNLVLNSGSNQLVANYAPNGQFLIHANVVPDTTSTPAGKITQPVTVLSQGGWTFERPAGSTATDIVTFEATGSPVTNPDASPKYHLRIVNQVPNATDTFKDVRLTFDDVNKFASTTQNYTYGFTVQSNSGSPISANIVLIKNFGTGGSPSAPTETTLANITIPASYGVAQTDANLGFVFGTNIGKVIGTNNDDKVQLALRLPTSAAFDVSVVDFILTPGALTLKNFPPTSNRQFSYQSITPPVPAYDGSDLYLPLRLTPNGLEYDRAEVGDVIAESQNSVYVNSLHPSSNRMLADGKQYETSGYSPLGIPYSRLQAKYWDDTVGLPIYGTGANYFTGIFTAGSAQLQITNNSAGVVTDASQGSVSTTFTIATAYKSINPGTGYYCRAFQDRVDGFYIQNLENGAVTASAIGTANVTTSTFREGTTDYPQISAFVVTGGIAAGTYFTFNTSHSGDIGWYVWFKVDGAGSDPTIGGRTGILVNLISGDSVDTIAQKIREALNNWQVTTIITVAASSVAAGSYFNIDSAGSPGVSYYVWYKKDNAGTDPAPANRIGILVNITSTDTAIQVAQKTQIAINQKFFATPDFRDYFLRGLSNGAALDPDAASRYSMVPGIIGDRLGTTELDSVIKHTHDNTINLTSSGGSLGNIIQGVPSGNPSIDGSPGSGVDVHQITLGASITNAAYGGSETRSINKNVNFAVIY